MFLYNIFFNFFLIILFTFLWEDVIIFFHPLKMNYYEDDCKFDIANKNTLILNLKHQLEKIEQNEKDYCELLNKCKNIENELQLMKEAKMKLDYE